MLAVYDRGVILQLVVVRVIGNDSQWVAAVRKRTQHGYCRQKILRRLAVPVADVLKARFIHNIFAQDLRIADLQRLLGVGDVVGLRRKRKLADSVVGFVVLSELVANHQRIVLA